MALADIIDGGSEPAVRKPGLAISFASSGGIGISAGLDALTGGSDDPWQRSLVSLVFNASLGPSIDSTRLHIALDEQSPSFSVDELPAVQTPSGYMFLSLASFS